MTLETVAGLDRDQVEAIVRFRAEHGPVRDAAELGRILGNAPLRPDLIERLDFAPADDTAPEAPGA